MSRGLGDVYKRQVYKQIVLALQDTFKISETEAIGLSSMSDTDFTNYYYRIEEYGKAVQ